MFFLATPHRGSDSAKLLNGLLRASAVLSPKQYVADLARNSTAITVINDEFRHFADDLHIWSFYETLKTRIGTNSVLLVEKDSAIIGMPPSFGFNFSKPCALRLADTHFPSRKQTRNYQSGERRS